MAPTESSDAQALLDVIDSWVTDERVSDHPIVTTLFELPGFVVRDALAASGWDIVHGYTRLRATLADWIEPSVRDDLVIRPAQSLGEMATVHELVEQAVAGHWKHQRCHFDEFLADQRTRQGHDSSLWFLANDDAPAGALIARDPIDRAWIASLGVHSDYRHRGIAHALLHTSFVELHRRGQVTVGVDVDTHNFTGAVHVYEHAGMKVVGRADQWSKTYG